MMKYLRNFLEFCKKFVIGDDWTVPVVVMWGLIALYSLAVRGFEAWYLLPLIVTTLLILVLTRAASKRVSAHEGRRYATHLRTLWLVMFAICELPYAWVFIASTFYNYNSFSLSAIVGPEAISCAVILVVAPLLAYFFEKHPVLVSMCAGTITVVITQALHHSQLSTVLQLGESAVPEDPHIATYGWTALLAALILIIVLMLVTYAGRIFQRGHGRRAA